MAKEQTSKKIWSQSPLFLLISREKENRGGEASFEKAPNTVRTPFYEQSLTLATDRYEVGVTRWYDVRDWRDIHSIHSSVIKTTYLGNFYNSP